MVNLVPFANFIAYMVEYLESGSHDSGGVVARKFDVFKLCNLYALVVETSP